MSNAPIKLTPLYPIVQCLNAQFTEPNGWSIPEVYTTLEAEIAAARGGVALADETLNGKVLIQGSQAEAVLHEAFDLPTLAIGSGVTIRGGEEARERGGEGASHQPPVTRHSAPRPQLCLRQQRQCHVNHGCD